MISKTLLLVDGSALIFRSFFAFIRNPLINSKGEETSAVYGTTSSMIRLLREMKPDLVAFVLDTGKPTFRHDMYDKYKAHRPETPPSLREQFPRVEEVIKTLSVPILKLDGYEADDLMGTLAIRAAAEGIETTIYSGDKDMLQLVQPHVRVVSPGRDGDKVIDSDVGVEERLGVPADRVIDLFALMGDASDNVPGVKGVGPKTAVKLLKENGNLEGVYENIESFKGKLKERLVQDRDNAFLSRKLVTLDTDVPLDVKWIDLNRVSIDPVRVAPLFRDLEFHRLLDEVGDPPEEMDVDYTLVSDDRGLSALAEELTKSGRFAFDTETTSVDPMRADLVGISVSTEPGRAWYVPIRHDGDPNVSLESARRILGPPFADPRIEKIAQHAKYDLLILENEGFDIQGVRFDPMIASYILDPGQRTHKLDHLALVHLNHKMIPISNLLGTGRNQKTMDELNADEVYEYACEDADFTLRLADELAPRLKEVAGDELFRDLEIPLLQVLKRMERNGVSLDVPFLEKMSGELRTIIDGMAKKIHELAGSEFNLNSPKQLQVILFENLGMKPRKKTKTGYSTDNDVLQELAREHPLPALILEYRQIEKLRGTYVDALPKLINPRTGRIHTSFNQTVAATGRLSSSDPGLQNIPIRTELGRKIRKAFLPSAEDRAILSLDYSQVELRLLAHLSEDEAMIADFQAGTDIHKRTASTLFGVEENDVSGEMRSRAKAVNFGIVYGMGAFGLASRLDLTRKEAQSFIDGYFQAYPGVKAFMERTVEEGRSKGYVETMLKRRRYLPDLNSTNGRMRSFAERTAVNTPIQGSAADLIKLAMIAIDEALLERKLGTKMILQVHDELVFDAPLTELDEITELATRLMEDRMELRVPLVVDSGQGGNWLEAHGLDGGA